ncbi:hypothetical protein [Kushneria phosphatilytica]|uniref:Uncharacterized protein n=1 Tax=Kushneria phosphatilytica TaxID=657387 RepID=A0A1S1NV24_9GAMM|nr:hypothetical protein [Kushneria phosphatilytica]OHV10261.1 hypothetical protein BH688_09685 [Kushneria phosphatilytica]QEL11561.1 hypothetical protein FY550_10745 [Kushneria phosphatilytica]
MKRASWILLLFPLATPVLADDIHELFCQTESKFAERMAHDRDAGIPLSEEILIADELAQDLFQTIETADHQQYSDTDRAALTARSKAWYSRKYRLVMALIYSNPDYVRASPAQIATIYRKQCLEHYRGQP